MRFLKIVFIAVVFIVFINDAMAKSFTDNANSTVKDNETGLIWQKGDGGSGNWESALTYCEGLSLGGKTNWRLPNQKELLSLVDYNRLDPALDTNYFTGKNSWGYWSATTDVVDTANAWFVQLTTGSTNFYKKSSFDFYVRCVSG